MSKFSKVLLVVVLVLAAGTVFAQTGTTPANEGGWLGSAIAVKYFAYFFALGMAVYGGTTGQSKAAAVALEGIARNPAAADKIQTPMILALALMESLVIFALISTFLV
ncbi:MAG: ATP synthase F0 subunit C [Rhizobacter sp.]|nr:ATP synthase F0 subunit C [Bacteriovorax sp.]